MSHVYLQYKDKDEVVLWMNTVGPYHNRQETYAYFSLPFCIGPKQGISHYHETLSDALQGVELQFSGLDVQFKGTSDFYYELCYFFVTYEDVLNILSLMALELDERRPNKGF